MKTRLRLVVVPIGRMLLALTLAALAARPARPTAAAMGIDISGPPGSGAFPLWSSTSLQKHKSTRSEEWASLAQVPQQCQQLQR